MKIREVFLSKDAVSDIESARDFYDLTSEKAGDYFVASILSDLESLNFYAGIHPVFFGFYRMLSRRFPFAIYYEINEDTVRVTGIFDMRSKPEGIIEKLKAFSSKKKVKETAKNYDSKPRKK
jgi:plasmid stabilization system protein ParE